MDYSTYSIIIYMIIYYFSKIWNNILLLNQYANTIHNQVLISNNVTVFGGRLSEVPRLGN